VLGQRFRTLAVPVAVMVVVKRVRRERRVVGKCIFVVGLRNRLWKMICRDGNDIQDGLQ